MANTESEKVGNDVIRLVKHLEEWLKLEAADKMAVLMTCIIVAAVMIALATSAVYFISMGVMKWIAIATGNEMQSCFIVGIALLLIMALFYLLRKPLVENRVVESVSRQMLEDEPIDNESEKGGAV